MILTGAAASYDDIKNREISNKILLPGFLIGVIIGVWDKDLPDAFIGSFIMAAPLYLLAYGFLLITGKQGLGGGDIKMAFIYGLYLKYPVEIFAVYFIIFILGGMLILINKLKAAKKIEDSGIPLIPFMSIAAIVVYILQNTI